MVIDCHVHIAATTPAHGKMSDRLLKTFPFRFMQWKFGFNGATPDSERRLRKTLFDTLTNTRELDKAVILAFDAVHTHDGQFDDANTHLYVTNDYVIELAAFHPKILFGASINPYRRDALAELERCIQAGAVLMKWLPMVQNFNPADPICFPFYEVLAHYKLPLLSHTGMENALPVMDPALADPMLLVPALERGVTVIAAHCGTRLFPTQPDHVPAWIRLALEYEHFYGDTAAINQFGRWRIYDQLFKDERLMKKAIHGSDWPILPVPPPHRLGLADTAHLLMDPNWLRRDILIKQRVGMDDSHFSRASTLLRLPSQTSK